MTEMALERLFTAKQLRSIWFSPSFLEQVPAAAVRKRVRESTSRHGRYLGVHCSGDRCVLRFEQGELPATICLTEDGKIEALRLDAFLPALKTLSDAVVRFAELPGSVGLLVCQDGEELAALGPDRPLAVGSAFKLAVLAAAREAVMAGRLRWDQVAELRPEDKSLPAGLLQDWPDGSPLTIHTLAALMISKSDNTATDALIRIVGRQDIERFAPQCRPLISAREAFVLKHAQHLPLAEQFGASDERTRRALLQTTCELSLPERGPTQPWSATPEIEWRFSARELCDLMVLVSDLPLTSINPGLVDSEAWGRVAFKGGADNGVLSLVTVLEGKTGPNYCIAVIQNDDAAINHEGLFSVFGSLITILKNRCED